MIWIETLIAICCIPWLYLLGRWTAIQLRRRRNQFDSFYRQEAAAQVKRQRASRP